MLQRQPLACACMVHHLLCHGTHCCLGWPTDQVTSVLLVLRLSLVTFYMVHVMHKMSCSDGQRAHNLQCFAAIRNQTNTPEGSLTTSVKSAATTSDCWRNEVRWRVFKQYAMLSSPTSTHPTKAVLQSRSLRSPPVSATQTRPCLWTLRAGRCAVPMLVTPELLVLLAAAIGSSAHDAAAGPGGSAHRSRVQNANVASRATHGATHAAAGTHAAGGGLRVHVRGVVQPRRLQLHGLRDVRLRGKHEREVTCRQTVGQRSAAQPAAP